MHFANLLPCVVALATPALGLVVPAFYPPFAAQVFSQPKFLGDKAEIKSGSCVNLSGGLHGNVQSILTYNYIQGILPSIGECRLYSNDGCNEPSYFDTVTTTLALNQTNVASIHCNYKITLP